MCDPVKQQSRYYTLFILGDVEPHLYGPFETPEKRDQKAIDIRKKEGADDGGLYKLNLDESASLAVYPYTGGFLDGDDEEDGETGVDENHQFLNHYCCPRCQNAWTDVCSAQPDDDCSQCGLRHVSPQKSEDIRDEKISG
jgi:hypothetical protein